jgi:hypothetical protein
MVEEHIFVQDCLKKHNVSISALAEKAGMGDSTLYEYTGGRKKNIPLPVWRALYELTEDVTILELVTGDVPSFVVPIPECDPQDASDYTVKRLIEKRRKDLECEMAILDVLADGKIDRNDKIAVDKYRIAHPEAQKLSAQIYKIITDMYDLATKAK